MISTSKPVEEGGEEKKKMKTRPCGQLEDVKVGRWNGRGREDVASTQSDFKIGFEVKCFHCFARREESDCMLCRPVSDN